MVSQAQDSRLEAFLAWYLATTAALEGAPIVSALERAVPLCTLLSSLSSAEKAPPLLQLVSAMAAQRQAGEGG